MAHHNEHEEHYGGHQLQDLPVTPHVCTDAFDIRPTIDKNTSHNILHYQKKMPPISDL